MSLGAILVIVFLIWLLVGLPQTGGRYYGYTGYGPSLTGLVFLLIVIWLLFGTDWGGHHHLSF
jgi:hypothetical protein